MYKAAAKPAEALEEPAVEAQALNPANAEGPGQGQAEQPYCRPAETVKAKAANSNNLQRNAEQAEGGAATAIAKQAQTEQAHPDKP